MRLSRLRVAKIPVTSTVNVKQIELILKDVLYAPRMMYNLILICWAMPCGLRTVIDDYNDNHSKRILKMINKSSGDTCMIGRESDEGL